MVRRQARDDHGAAALEFALVAPLLILLVVGIIDYGIMLSFRQAISQSAAEGARAAAVTTAGGNATTNAENAVSQAIGRGISCNGTNLLQSGSSVGTCTVTKATCTNNTAKQCVTVVISYDYQNHPVAPQLPLVPMPNTLSYTAVSEVN